MLGKTFSYMQSVYTQLQNKGKLSEGKRFDICKGK